MLVARPSKSLESLVIKENRGEDPNREVGIGQGREDEEIGPVQEEEGVDQDQGDEEHFLVVRRTPPFVQLHDDLKVQYKRSLTVEFFIQRPFLIVSATH
ncbi:hypothetical protein GE061_019392 [Apolygus lucorum]|uniref:Uncharacterized protein n=1 Tax=Apolygus lucorum TaxID=248454 RepID=A0A8S9XCE5_APOLU|nr:hypothetical protein GE061_019392 [Apolygus lucorum]